ncbi:MAG TPA: hypothetical protein VGH89_28115 [Pseudonocardia sp.]|jgi:hypothetical protein
MDDALTGLARAVERHSRMIAAGRGDTASLAATVEQLARSVRAATKAWSASPAPTAGDGAQHDHGDPSESDVDGEADSGADAGASAGEPALPSWLVTEVWEPGQELMEALRQWVQGVYLRWPDAVLAVCWPLHPWVVEELWVLRCCWWAGRTGQDASWLRWQDWHDRQRPATARRIAEGLRRCGPDQHVPAAGGPYPAVPGADVLPLAVTAWATESHQTWPPHIQVELLDEPERRSRHTAGIRTPGGVPRRTLGNLNTA